MSGSVGEALAQARLDGRKLKAAAGPAPKSLEQAYSVQDAMTEALGLPVAGWKIGATSKEVQAMLKADGPFYGPMFDRWIYPAPNRIPVPEGGMNIVEAEFAFRMNADLPARDEPYTADEIAEAVAAVFPAIEIVDRRMTGGFDVDVMWLAADGGANHAFSHGEGRADWRDLDLPSLAVRVSMGDEEIGTGTGANTLGSPFNALSFLVEALRARGRGLRAGDWVTTGVVAPVFAGRRGEPIVAEFDGLGRVEIALV